MTISPEERLLLRQRLRQRQPRYSKEEFAQRGDALYDSQIRSQIDEEGDRGKIVAIDLETGDFEVDASEIAACDRLEASHPDSSVSQMHNPG
jgi:hypothetical protein